MATQLQWILTQLITEKSEIKSELRNECQGELKELCDKVDFLLAGEGKGKGKGKGELGAQDSVGLEAGGHQERRKLMSGMSSFSARWS